MGLELDITCPACGLGVSPVKKKLPGVGSVLAFGFFCPSTSCNARLDHVLAEKGRDDPTKPDSPAALASMREQGPARAFVHDTTGPRPPKNLKLVEDRPRTTADLKQEIPARCAELRARVDALRSELSETERELSLFERMNALLSDDRAADAAE